MTATSVSALRAFFFLLESEPMPADADDAWFLKPSPGIRSTAEIETFVDSAHALVRDVATAPMDEEVIQALFYTHAKRAFGDDPKDIRRFFSMLYLLVFGRNHGPRWGQFVLIAGAEVFCARVENVLADPLGPHAPLFPPSHVHGARA